MEFRFRTGLARRNLESFGPTRGPSSPPTQPTQWVGTSSRAPTGGRVLEGVIKLPLSPPQARKFWRYGL